MGEMARAEAAAAQISRTVTAGQHNRKLFRLHALAQSFPFIVAQGWSDDFFPIHKRAQRHPLSSLSPDLSGYTTANEDEQVNSRGARDHLPADTYLVKRLTKVLLRTMMRSTSLQRRHAIALLAAVVAVILLTSAFWHYTQDDVFITYAYSRNIAQGVGFVFNPGERVQGTTTPLWALTMAGIYALTPDLLHGGNLLSGLLLLAASVCAYALVNRYVSSYAQFGIILLLATSPLNYASFGMETMLYCALLFAAFLLWRGRHYPLAMAAAAALTWTRADGVVLGGTLLILALFGDGSFRQRFVRAIKLGSVYVAVITPWFLFAWGYFGTPLPNTFAAKQEFLRGIEFVIAGLERWNTFFGNNPLSLLALVFIPVGLWRAWHIAPLRPLPLWTLLYALGYIMLNVTNFWYYTPLVNVLIVLAVIGADAAARQIIRYQERRGLWRTGALALLGVAVALNVDRAVQLSAAPPRMATYKIAGEWIAAHTPQDSTLLVADLGVVGYYAQRYTIDSFGLIVPDMLFKTPEYATVKYKPDYLLATQYFLWRYTQDDWFRSLYVPVAQFSTRGDAEFSPMTLYRRRAERATPVTALEGTTLFVTFPVELSAGELLPEVSRASLESGGEIVSEVEQPFLTRQYPVLNAPEDELLLEQVMLPLPTASGEYQWNVTAPVESQGMVVVTPLKEEANYVAVVAEWTDFASLDGILLPDGETWSGGSLRILLDWRLIAEVEHDYTVFLHLLNSDGVLVAQGDSMPSGGRRPTSGWALGERVVDEHEIVLPPDLAEGIYSLRVGWYDWQTQERVLLADGNDAFDLPVTIPIRFPGGSGLP
jgi:hypothetical protein